MTKYEIYQRTVYYLARDEHVLEVYETFKAAQRAMEEATGESPSESPNLFLIKDEEDDESRL